MTNATVPHSIRRHTAERDAMASRSTCALGRSGSSCSASVQRKGSSCSTSVQRKGSSCSASVQRKGSNCSTNSYTIRSCSIRRNSSVRSNGSCCLRRKSSARSITSCTVTRKISSCSTTSRSSSAAAPEEQFCAAQLLAETPGAKVLLARRRCTGARVVLKCVPKGGAPGGAFWRELACRRRLGQHPHLLACHPPAYEAPSAWVLALEAAPCGDLSRLLGRRGLGESGTKQVVQQVVAALQHMHEHHMVHRDVCTENVLVFDRRVWFVKLGDLGSAYEEGALVKKGAARGPWSPPEVSSNLPQEGYHAHSTQDAWQLGLLLVACLTGALPWEVADVSDPNYNAWVAWLKRASPRLPSRFRGFTPRLLRLLRRLLQPRPELRSGVREVNKYLQDAWLTSSKACTRHGLEQRARTMLARAGVKFAEVLLPLLGTQSLAAPHDTPRKVTFSGDCEHPRQALLPPA